MSENTKETFRAYVLMTIKLGSTNEVLAKLKQIPNITSIAVITGVIISALAFAWKHAKIYARSHTESDGTKVYELDGPLFFGSATTFNDNFDFKGDPDRVALDFKFARVMDASGVEAIDNVTKKYKESGKTLTLRHLSVDCKNMLKEAGPYCTYEEDDPTYKVAINY